MSLLDRPLRALAKTLPRVPRRLVRVAAGRPKQNRRGTALDPHVQLLLRMSGPAGISFAKGEVQAARDNLRRSARLGGKPYDRGVARRDLVVGGVAARAYTPPGAAGPLPLLVWLHGGGWVVGDLDTADATCGRAAVEMNAIIVSLDYRLAPEHPWPAGLEDALAAFRDVLARAGELGADPARIGIGGGSAGGNLSAIACRRLRDEGGPQPHLQLLVYPSTDLRRNTDSFDEFAEGFLLTRAGVDWCLEKVQPDVMSPDASPALAEDLSGLPPAVVVTAGFDPLRDEGEAYARALEAAGVPVVHVDAADQIHGFLSMDLLSPRADAAVDRLLQEARALAWR
jgi:acetyl esterase